MDQALEPHFRAFYAGVTQVYGGLVEANAHLKGALDRSEQNTLDRLVECEAIHAARLIAREEAFEKEKRAREEEVEDLKEKRQRVERDSAALVEEMREKLAEFEKVTKEGEGRLAAQAAEIDGLRESVVSQTEEIDGLTREATGLREEVATLKAALQEKEKFIHQKMKVIGQLKKTVDQLCA